MKYDIKVPGMGESISEATVGVLLKQSGAVVAMDDEILELETDKVNQVLYAPRAGVLTLTVKEEDVVKIGQVIGYVDAEVPAEAASQPATKEKSGQAKADASKQETAKAQPAPQNIIEEKEIQEVPVDPVRITKELWLEEIASPKKKVQQEPKRGRGSQSFVQETDPGRRETRAKMSKIRRLIAARLVEVQQNTAMLTTFNEVDMTVVMSLREKYKDDFMKEHGVKLGFMSFFVKACASALLTTPEINSYIDGEEIVHREYVDIGIAVGTPRGLIVPVVRDCDKLSFAQIEQKIEAYAKRSREGGLSVDDLQGGGFTITNGGVYGSLLSTPIINPPQCAILGMHKIMKRAVVVEDRIEIRQMMYLALSYDHRIVDGKEAVGFLVHVKNYLEDPSRLLLEV